MRDFDGLECNREMEIQVSLKLYSRIIIVLVVWRKKKFDITNSFNGQIYTVPFNGIYFFKITLKGYHGNWNYIQMKVDLMIILFQT